jgi:ABC-type branched-subunit amino acid transport system substrate-binding protein
MRLGEVVRRVVVLVALGLASAACGTTLHQQSAAIEPTATTAAVGEAGSGGAIGDGGPDSTLPGASGTGTAGGTPSASTVASQGPASGAPSGAGAAVTGQIKLGFLTTATGNASSLGINLGQSFTDRQAVEAVVRALNAQGGIAGRQIAPVFARTDTGSVSWEADYAAACATLTQDNKVQAVLGYSFAFFDSFESCLARANVVHLTTAYGVADAAGMRQYPLLYSLAAPNIDRYLATVLTGAVTTGFVGPKNTVGILRSGCPYDQRAWATTGAPLVKRLGVNVATIEEMSCISGASGAGSVVTQIQSAVLRFRSRGVDTVWVEGPPAIIFSSAAESQGWRPRYLVSSQSGGAALVGNVAAPQLANFHGFGWLPTVDVLPPQQPARNATQQRCLALLRSQGLSPTQHADFGTAFGACDALFVYESALRVTRGNSDPSAVVPAIDRLGAGQPSAYTYGGLFRFGGLHDNPAAARPWAWDGGCSCFTYIGQAYGMP